MLLDLANRFARLSCTAFIFYLVSCLSLFPLLALFFFFSFLSLFSLSYSLLHRRMYIGAYIRKHPFCIRLPSVYNSDTCIHNFLRVWEHQQTRRSLTTRLCRAVVRSSGSELIVVACVNIESREIKPTVVSSGIQSPLALHSDENERLKNDRPRSIPQTAFTTNCHHIDGDVRSYSSGSKYDTSVDRAEIRWMVLIATLADET